MGKLKTLGDRGSWARARANPHPQQAKAARWIRGLRGKLKMTQGELGKVIGVSLFTVYRWERFDGQYPHPIHVIRLGLLEKGMEKKERKRK